MIFSQDLVDKVSSAVLCSFNGTTSNDEKQKAFRFLEDLKENYPNICLNIAGELFKQVNQQSMLHHYALHLIENLIKSKWSNLKIDERNGVKDQLFFIIQNSSVNRLFIEPIYIRNSLGKCFIELIKRDCFDKGNTTFDELVNLMQNIGQIREENSTQLELILLVYHFLNEELTTYAQSIQAQRRRQILNQIQKRLNEILPCLIRFLNDLSTLSDRYERLTQTCLFTLNSFLNWVEYNHFEQYELFLCELFLKFFQLNSLKLLHGSFECLISLVNKRLARRQLQQMQQQRNKRIASAPSSALNCEQEKRFLDYFLGNNTLELFYRRLISPSVSFDSIDQLRTIVTNDHLNCLKMFGQFLIKLSNYLLQLFQQLVSKSIDDQSFLSYVNERTSSFLQFLLLLNQHPFHQLSLNSYQAINSFLSRQPILLSNEEFCLKFIRNLKQSLHRIHFSSTNVSQTIENENEFIQEQIRQNQRCLVYTLFEYDSEEQFFWKFFSQYRSELQKLIKSFITMFFNDSTAERTINVESTISCLRSIVQNLFNYLESLVQRTPSKTINLTSTSLTSIYTIIEWEAFYLLLDHILFIIRQELFTSSTSINRTQEKIGSIFMTTTISGHFLRTVRFLLQFTPDLSEHIHGYVLNLLSCMFFITSQDASLAIQIIQRLLNTYQFYQQQSIKTEMEISACETMQTQSTHAFLYLCKNYTVKMVEFYAELFPYLCQLYKNEFQLTKTFLTITVDESSCSTLKLLDAIQILLYHKFIHENSATTNSTSNLIEDFYVLIKPIYETLNISLTADSLGVFVDFLDLCSRATTPANIIRYRRRCLMLSLHCLCLLLRYSKQQQNQLSNDLRSKICACLRPVLFDYVLKVTQFCNQLYNEQANPFYQELKANLIYSETERQLYLGTYESNNLAKSMIPSTTTTSGLPVAFNRSLSTSNSMIDDQRFRDYLHRLFDICYQINGIYFAHDTDLYCLKLNDDAYFLTLFLQKILFEHLNSLPSFRLRIVLRQFCRLFVENYCSLSTSDKESINELFLSFLDVFLPYIQQRLTTMWNQLSMVTNNSRPDQCSDEVIEECVCVLITRDFLDIIRYFLFKTIATSGTGGNPMKKKTKNAVGRQHSESMCDEMNGDIEQIDEWDEQTSNNNISNKLLNSTQDKLEHSDLFTYMVKTSRQNSPLSLRLFTYVIQVLFECLTYPDAYCVNRALPIILPLTKLHTDIIDKHVNRSTLVDRKLLFQSLIKSFVQHYENEGLNTNLISLIGHIYELWHQHYSEQLDLVLHQTIPQMNIEILNAYKARLLTMNNSKKPQPITERERRDTFKNLLNPLLLTPVTANKKETSSLTNSSQTNSTVTIL
uniref:Exportin-T n=1 Tax=Philodina roseola TaxID=96448 RepID=B6S375_PHIRO|nr:exportin 5-like protein [Philodina roseola]